jgi:hypothetical protein
MSELKYTKSGTPFINLIDAEGRTYGDFIFSSTTKTATGYKYICFTHRYDNQVATKSGKGTAARTKFVEVAVKDSYVFNMLLKRDSAGKKGVPSGMIPRRLAEWIIAVLGEFTMEGIFPFSAIKLLEPIVAELDINRILVTESERVRAAKKKIRLEKKQEKIVAKDRSEAEEKIMRDCVRIENCAGMKGELFTPPNSKAVKLLDIF